MRIAATAMAAACLAGSSFAAELLTNGGFETGDFTGWTTVTGAGGELTPWAVSGSTYGWFGSSAPLSGSFSAQNGFDGDAGLTYELYQDVAIPVAGAILTTNHRIQYDGLGIVSTLDRVMGVEIRDTSNAWLATLYTQNITMNGAAYTDTGWLNNSFDLSAYGGMTVRVTMTELIPESFTGPAHIQFDDISVSTVPEPATMAILGAGLLFGARRRRK